MDTPRIRSMLHDLCQPLCAIQANADVARKFLSKSKYQEVDEILADILSDSSRMTRIINDLREIIKEDKENSCERG